MRRFTMFRRGVMPETHSDLHKNAPDEPQFEGVVLSNGKCVISWLTPINSVSVWASLDDMIKFHGHPEYGSELVWHDEPNTSTPSPTPIRSGEPASSE